MAIVRFIAFLGTVMAIYAAAALQNGPETTDANLCKLARRFSDSVPEKCILAFDDIGTALAIIFGFACLILLLWDFKVSVRAKCVQVIGWSRPGLKRVSVKVEPYVVQIGLFVALIGIAVIAYGAWKKPHTIAATALTEDRPDPSRPSMLSGRTVSGIEIASRLERLEKEHAITVSKLAAAEQQLEKKSQELETAKGIPPVGAPLAPQPIPEQRQLSPYEADLKLRAIDKILSLLSKDMQSVIDKFPPLQGWWNALKDPKNNPTFRSDLLAFRDEFKAVTLKLDNLRNEMPEYQDLIGMAQQTAYNGAVKAIERYLIQFMYVQDTVKPDASKEALLAFMDDCMTDYHNSMNEFVAWRNTARSNILEMRRKISP